MTAIKRAAQTAKEQSPDYRRSYPMSKAQSTVIAALGLDDDYNFAQAEIIFSELSIIVTSKRQGRKSIPAVAATADSAGMTAEGDYDVAVNEIDSEVAQLLAEWM